MFSIRETLSNSGDQTAFINLEWGNYVMIVVACVFLFLAIRKGLRAASARSDRIWYASGKYLPGYYGRTLCGRAGN